MKKRIVSALLLGTILLGGMNLTGCSKPALDFVWTSSLSNSTVFKVGDEAVKINEAKLVLANYKNLYEEIYGDDVWNQKHGDSTMEDYVKELTISELAKMKVIVQLANKDKVTLSEAEEKKVEAAAEEYYATLSEDDLDGLDVSKSDIEKLYYDYTLASKLYNKLTGGVVEEVSDDDARVMRVYQIIVDDISLAEEIQEKIDAGVEFTSLVNSYSTTLGEIKLYKQNMDDAIAKELSQLNDGDVSGCIHSNNKFYFYKVISKIDRELTDQNKETLIKERAAKAFDTEYAEYLESIKSTLNEKAWNDVSLKKEKSITTSSFFKIWDEYCGNI